MAASHSAVNRLPEFQEVWDAYPEGGQSDVLKSLGQEKEGVWRREESSALFVSLALAGAGHGQPRTFKVKPEQLKDAAGNLLCVDVSDLVSNLKENIGAPKHAKDASKIAGQKGIVYFEGVAAIKDQSGHIDLFDGTTTKGTEYFTDATKVWFWEMK
ncbi:unnamed protein product [Symbiodinium sp. KB8]|nr:unnamed protein product [Symbiodinium sp. KB8]